MEQGEERKNIKYVTFGTEISLKSMASPKAVQNDGRKNKTCKKIRRNRKSGLLSKESSPQNSQKRYYFAALAALMASMSRGVTLNLSLIHIEMCIRDRDHMPVGGVFPLAQIADKPQRHLQGIALKVLGSIDLDVDLVSVQGIFIIKGVVYIGAAAIGQGDGGGAEERCLAGFVCQLDVSDASLQNLSLIHIWT